MSTRFYHAEGLDVERMAHDIEGMFLSQGYQVQHFGGKDFMTVQFKKGGDFEAILGLQAALTVTLNRVPNGVVAAVGQQKWIDKAVVGTVGMLYFFPLMLTAGVGLFRQSQLESQLLGALDSVVRQQKGGVEVGAVPPHIWEQMERQAPHPPYGAPQGTPHYSPPGVTCPKCKAANEVGDAYCSHCGTSLIPEKKHCPKCEAELKPDAAFCAKCGSSVT